MGKKIKTFNLNGILKQCGFGTPNHMAPKGSEFTDMDTTNIYTNVNGVNTWKLVNFTGTTSINITGGTIDDNKNILILRKDNGTNISISGDTSYFDTEMNFVQDATLTTILFKGVIGGDILRTEAINSIEAVANGVDIRIQRTGGVEILIDTLDISKTYIDGSLVTQVLVTAIVELNTLFANAGGGTGVAPTITSPSVVNMLEGSSLNYLITSVGGVAYSFLNLPTGLEVVQGNPRQIIGGKGLTTGNYSFTVRVTNYYSEVTQLVTLNVNPVFTNTKSVDGTSTVHFIDNTNSNSIPLYRPSNGTGASDAWSVVCWIKTVNQSGYNDLEGIFSFGNLLNFTIGTGGGYGNNIYFQIYMGVWGNQLTISTNTGTAWNTGWHMVAVTYDGGTTGSVGADINLYYSRFKIYFDGVLQANTNSNQGNGFTGAIDSSVNPFKIGAWKDVFAAIRYMPNYRIDEFSLYDTELSSNTISSIFDGGNPVDLTTLTPLFTNHYRFGDAPLDISAFPILHDINTTTGLNLNMVNGTIASYVNDVPATPASTGLAVNFTNDVTSTTTILRNPNTSAIIQQAPRNTLEAVISANNTDIKIQYVGGEVLQYNVDLANCFIDSVLVTQVLATSLTELNAYFNNTGLGVPPTITSSSTIIVNSGSSINYTLTGTQAVAHSWDTLPTGVATVNGDVKNIIGGNNLSAGTYNIIGRITNYYGSVTSNISLIVAIPFVNSYSFDGTWSAYMINNIVGQENNTPLYRPSNGTGASDAWSMNFWVKQNNTNDRGILSYGRHSSSVDAKLSLTIKKVGSYNNLLFHYGTNVAYLSATVITASTPGTWQNIGITYNGGDTNLGITSQGYFKFYENGVLLSATWTMGGTGWSGSMEKSAIGYPFRILRTNWTSTSPGTKIDEYTDWDSELTQADMVSLYNLSTPFDVLSSFTPLPYDYFRFGDAGDIANYPIMTNHGTTGPDLEMISGAASNYVSDVP